MAKFKHQGGKKSETILQENIMKMMTWKGWFTKNTHGSLYSSGWPDFFASHRTYGHRWIEVKMPDRSGDPFTKMQHETFPELCSHGSGVWVLVAATEEEYAKLFQKFNWWIYTGSWKNR